MAPSSARRSPTSHCLYLLPPKPESWGQTAEGWGRWSAKDGGSRPWSLFDCPGTCLLGPQGVLVGDKRLAVISEPNLVDETILWSLRIFKNEKSCQCLKITFCPQIWLSGNPGPVSSWKVSWGSDAAASLEVGHVSSSLPKSPRSRSDTCFPSLRRVLGSQRHLSLRPQPPADMETPVHQLPSGLEAERP